MKIKTTTTSLLAAIVITCASSLLMPVFGGDNYNERIKHNVMISSNQVSSPIGYFLLARKGKAACAIRFTDYNRHNSFAGNGPIISKNSADYDYFYQGDGSGDFKKPNVEAGHLKAGENYVGISNTVGGGSDPTSLMCGSLELPWDGTIAIKFFQGAEPHDEGIKLAPTKWRDVNEINVYDMGYTWYRYDKTRELIEMPVEKLW